MADNEWRDHGVSDDDESYWIASTPETSYPSLKEGTSVDVAILGRGITGITSAKLLKDTGLSVALVESRRILQGVTGKTTATISSQGFYYKKLIENFGEEKARACAESIKASIENIADLVKENRIECDFARVSEYFYVRQTFQQRRKQALCYSILTGNIRPEP